MGTMVTNLKIMASNVQGGRTMKALSYRTTNQSLHLMTQPLSKLLFWMLECDSNNTVATVVPRDVATIRQQWGFYKEELETAKMYANQPMGKLETNFKILLPHPVEMKMFTNQKLDRVAHQVYNLCRVSMSLDSSGTKNFVPNTDYKTIQECIDVVEGIMTKFIGTGLQDAQSGKWDTGVDVSPLIELGTLNPDTDEDSATLQEGSAERTETHLDDGVDAPPGGEEVSVRNNG